MRRKPSPRGSRGRADFVAGKKVIFDVGGNTYRIVGRPNPSPPVGRGLFLKARAHAPRASPCSTSRLMTSA
ncbi:type II toxin-antitoxin system HigB family toxin [Rhizobium sp. WYJ-E13]|nr:type II toxin-antitoxin system HigB family toxin [Rhizobium sp. WYJ-E13]